MSFHLDNASKPVIDSYFRKYDTDHNGYISHDELKILIAEAGYSLSDDAFRIFLTATGMKIMNEWVQKMQFFSFSK